MAKMNSFKGQTAVHQVIQKQRFGNKILPKAD